jgi:hypothetical protein
MRASVTQRMPRGGAQRDRHGQTRPASALKLGDGESLRIRKVEPPLPDRWALCCLGEGNCPYVDGVGRLQAMPQATHGAAIPTAQILPLVAGQQWNKSVYQTGASLGKPRTRQCTTVGRC